MFKFWIEKQKPVGCELYDYNHDEPAHLGAQLFEDHVVIFSRGGARYSQQDAKSKIRNQRGAKQDDHDRDQQIDPILAGQPENHLAI